jgi:hypothetical protein
MSVSGSDAGFAIGHGAMVVTTGDNAAAVVVVTG